MSVGDGDNSAPTLRFVVVEEREERPQPLALTVREVAALFASMNDDQQARFFCEVGSIAETWARGALWQWHAVGRHLATCECSTDEGRSVVREIAAALNEVPTP